MPSKKMFVGIGERLRLARLKANLSQQDVAQELGRVRQTIAAWESSTNDSVPNAVQLAQLCVLYGCSANRILFGANAHDAAEETGEHPPTDFDALTEKTKSRLWMLYQVFVRRGAAEPESTLPGSDGR